ncbi:MAG TPA: aldehyde dehydrogenase family protein [Acidimicrobiia bacterium]|nr:aldehyde dehydrogenase family protein [Acidimicrobiia bacterium]
MVEPASTDLELTTEEARVLGCLMEKSATTPDNYPLSLNGLMTACNQTTNRDPVVAYDEATVERALDSLRAKGLARRVMATGQRVVKHRHVVEEVLQLHVPEFAILGVLLLRGPQTPGELKQRTERWHTFRSLEDLEATLQRLADRGFARHLERRPGQKEARWLTLLVSVDEAVTPAAPVERQVAETHDAVPAAVTEQAPPEERSLSIRNPATGAKLRDVAVTEEREIGQKVERARRAQRAWSSRPYEHRAELLQRFAALLEGEAEECARLTTSEVGKPIRQSRNEIRAVHERIMWNTMHVGQVLAPRLVTAAEDNGAVVERISYEPVGVVAHISAWNYPYFVALNSMVPALLAGNAVLYKPSEHATLTGLRLVDLFHRAGVPVDVVQAVVGSGAAGSALVHADVDMVCFTGSYATGRKVAAAAADRLLRVQLELGGKDAAYVCDDVDAESAAFAIAEGACYNGGQSCCAVERVYVHDAIYDGFVDALVEVVAAYRVGDPDDDATDVGPLARAAQLDILDAQVGDAIAKGATVRCGGERIAREGNWYAPTVLVDVDDRTAIMREESFGPVVPVARVRNDDDAVARMDDTEFGLGAAVFTDDRSRAERILARLDVGNAYWNTSDRSSVRLPWAGRRHSGSGVSMSEDGIKTFVRQKAWHENATL